MPTSPYFPTYHQGHSGEQTLVQNLVDEQIKLFGSDIYYLPKTVLKDATLDEVRYTKFQDQFQIEMMLVNVMGFGDNAEFVSKFGLRITDEIIFRVSTNRWDEEVAEHSMSAKLEVPSRPNEGDLLYYPLTEDLYEIKYVGKEEPFFQFGKIQFYALTAELYEVGSDDLATGVAEIDAIEELFDTAIALTMGVGGTGDFTAGETVTGGTTSTTAEVKSWDSSTRILQVINRTGTFAANESLTGNNSGAVWVVSTFDTLQDTNSEYDQNRQIEDTADNIVDWSEGNPFGEFGNFTGSI
tara:strand:- start:1248 stop:2138 length:891 start_codon:yes stop_codon:yes gene_type:complete